MNVKLTMEDAELRVKLALIIQAVFLASVCRGILEKTAKHVTETAQIKIETFIFVTL